MRVRHNGALMLMAGLLIGASCGLLIAGLLDPAPEVVASPGGQERIICLIDQATDSLDAQLYLLTSEDAIDALVRAHRRGVDVRVILERDVPGGENEDAYVELASAGVMVRYASSSFYRTHSKLIIIDGQEALVGSHNLSEAALSGNREVSVLIRDREALSHLISLFEDDWSIAS